MPLAAPYKPIDQTSDLAPPHPGEILREEMLPHYKVTADELALTIGVPVGKLKTVLAERAPITRALARRLGWTIGHGPHYWLALQLQYDLWHGLSGADGRAR